RSADKESHRTASAEAAARRAEPATYAAMTGKVIMKVRTLTAVLGVLIFGGVPCAMADGGDTASVKAACTPDKSPKLKEIADRGELRWAVGIAAPFAAKDASGQYVGTEPENAKDFADILGVRLEIKDYTYDLLPPTVATGNADIVGSAL